MSPHRVLQYRQPLWCCRIDGEMHHLRQGRQIAATYPFQFPVSTDGPCKGHTPARRQIPDYEKIGDGWGEGLAPVCQVTPRSGRSNMPLNSGGD